MKVETFELQDVKEETIEQSAEARELCAQLGLTGQIKKTEEGAVKARTPYRLMKDDELFVYTILCPERSDVHTLSNEPIPLDVLKTLAYAKTLNTFEYFEVWSASSKNVKDPVLVAYEKRYDNKRFILARWGDELLPLEVLIPDALKRWWNARQDSLHQIKQRIEAELNSVCPSSIPTDSRRTMPQFYA